MKITKICLHHSAVSYLKNPDQWEATNNYHREKFKPYEKTWKDYKSSLGFYNGYHFELSMLGKIRQARRIGETSAAVWQNNMNDGHAIHIMMDGNFDIEYPTKELEKNLRKLLLRLLKQHPTIDEITYHRDFAVKTCPGKLIKDNWAKNLIRNNTSMIIKKENEPMLYVPVGNKLIHFKTDWPTYAKNFESETIIELNEKEFEKFEVVKNVTINNQLSR